MPWHAFSISPPMYSGMLRTKRARAWPGRGRGSRSARRPGERVCVLGAFDVRARRGQGAEFLYRLSSICARPWQMRPPTVCMAAVCGKGCRRVDRPPHPSFGGVAFGAPSARASSRRGKERASVGRRARHAQFEHEVLQLALRRLLAHDIRHLLADFANLGALRIARLLDLVAHLGRERDAKRRSV